MMDKVLLAALILFNTEVARFRAEIAPTARIFMGAQPGPIDGVEAWAWTKCVPDSPSVYVVQVAEKTLELPAERISFAAAHEVCHVAIHRNMICTAHGDTPKMAEEANICATRLMAERDRPLVWDGWDR